MLPEVTINYWAMLACVAASMALGYVWYSMPVFGRTWMQLIGKTEEELKKGTGPAMGIALVLSFIAAYVFAHVLDYVSAETWMEGVTTAGWMWFGFIFAIVWMQNIFAQRPFKLTVINSGYHLVQFLIFGIILTLWK